MDRPQKKPALGLAAVLAAIAAPAAAVPARFSFGPGPVPPGWEQVLPETAYSPSLGYGFEPGGDIRGVDRGGSDPAFRHFCTSGRPFLFSVAVPPGNYCVTAVLGDPEGESATTIRAEVRRLEVEGARTGRGRPASSRFIVNVRTAAIAGGRQVALKPRERTGEFRDWDERLTLEFDGGRPCICSLEIERAPGVPTLYLAGDSTVCDQPYEPFCSWGQMLPRFLGPCAAVANHAESGESLRSFVAEGRLAKLDTLMRPGDFLFIQFGHNDQKERGEGVGAFTTYAASLGEFIEHARSRGATPVLVTPVNRRTFGPSGRIVNSLGDFPEAVRRVARERGVALIDLNAMSDALYEALGPRGAEALFASVNGRVEGTHHDDYGAYELAKCVVEGIRAAHLSAASCLLADTPRFDPSRPDPPASFDVPPSERAATEVPYGN